MEIWRKAKTDRPLKLTSLIVLIIAALLIPVVPQLVYAGTLLANRQDKLSTSAANAIASHEFRFQMLNTTTAVGSISFRFCANSPIIGDVCTTPPGLNTSARTLEFQGGDTGFSIHPSSTATDIILTRLPTNPVGTPSVYRFINITNPNTAGSYYVRLQTFSSTDATGADIEMGGIAFAINPGLSVSSEVPPFLRFCAGVTIVSFDCETADSFFIDLGQLSSSQTSKAASQMVAVTNAASGYSIFIDGTSLTSGNNVIPALATQTPSAAGTSQFGINLRANSIPAVGSDPVGPGTAGVNPNYNLPNLYRYQAGDAVVTTTTSNDYRKFTVSYITNISSSQRAGVYATTISFICLANF